MADIEVWYVLIDSDNVPVGEPSMVILGHNDTILHLKMRIKDGEYQDDLAYVNTKDMEVWRFEHLTLSDANPGEMDKFVKDLDFTHAGKSLASWLRVVKQNLQEDEPLVVRLVQKAKRKREDDDYLEGARSSKLARIEPSKANDASAYESLQGSQQERILDDCPNPDADIPALPLLYSGFGVFRDAAENPGPDLLESGLMNEVDELAKTMCNLGYERVKQDNTRGHLQQIFSPNELREFSYAVENGSQAMTDGYLLASHGGPLLVIEYKRQIAMAEPQLASYFIRLALKPVESIFRQWRQPALGLLIRGTYISFHGLVMVDSQVRVLPLTPAFPCNDSELYDRMPLYAAFGAARRLLACIERDAASFVGPLPASPPPAILGSCRRHPNITSLLRVSSNNTQAASQVGERVYFQITEKLVTGLEGKRLYLASTSGSNPQVILVKFARQYSRDLHQFCASIEHAPQLLAFETLPGGWFGIAMEYLPSAERILESKTLANYGRKWLKDIDDIVTKIHTRGYVHGDLRPPNFIVVGETLLLIDFDWGGRETEATFPQARLHPILRDSRWETQITKDRDLKVMDYTKGKIREIL